MRPLRRRARCARVQVRPSKSPSTKPRQYSCAWRRRRALEAHAEGGLVRHAPGSTCSPAPCCRTGRCGRSRRRPACPTAVPGCAGTRRTAAAPAARPWPSIFAPISRRRRSGGTAPVNWNDSCAVSSATTDTTIISAVRDALRVEEIGQHQEKAQEDHHEQVAPRVHLQHLEGHQQHQHRHAGIAPEQGVVGERTRRPSRASASGSSSRPGGMRVPRKVIEARHSSVAAHSRRHPQRQVRRVRRQHQQRRAEQQQGVGLVARQALRDSARSGACIMRALPRCRTAPARAGRPRGALRPSPARTGARPCGSRRAGRAVRRPAPSASCATGAAPGP